MLHYSLDILKFELTAINASITVLHVCRLVALVTSKSNSLVVFLICEEQPGSILTFVSFKRPQTWPQLTVKKLAPWFSHCW